MILKRDLGFVSCRNLLFKELNVDIDLVLCKMEPVSSVIGVYVVIAIVWSQGIGRICHSNYLRLRNYARFARCVVLRRLFLSTRWRWRQQQLHNCCSDEACLRYKYGCRCLGTLDSVSISTTRPYHPLNSKYLSSTASKKKCGKRKKDWVKIVIN